MDAKLPTIFNAIYDGNLEQVQALLNEGIDPNERHPNGFETPILSAIYANNPEILRAILQAGGDPDNASPYTPAETAIANENIIALKILLENGAKVNHPTFGRETLLQEATRKGLLEIVSILLDAGADPDLVIEKKDFDVITNYSPIELASMTGNVPLATLLLKKSERHQAEIEQILFITSIAAGDLAAVKKHVKSHPDSLEQIDEVSGQTPLIAATIRSRVDIVKFLLSKGANPNTIGGKKVDYQSPLIAAVCSARLQLVELIIKAGANLDYASKDNPEWTALQYAKDASIYDVAQFLQRKMKSLGKTVIKSMPTGVTTFDTNDAALLVQAPVGEVTKAYAARINDARQKSDVYGKKIALTERSYAIFRISGQPWTCILRLICPEYQHWPSIGDAETLSRTLKCRTLLVANSDTAGASQYVLFENGKVIEYFEHADFPEDVDSSFLVRRFKEIYKVDLSHLQPIQTRESNAFSSGVRKMKLPADQNDLQFIEAYIKSLNAYIPFGMSEWEEPGDKSEMVLEELDEDDIEQFDVILCK